MDKIDKEKFISDIKENLNIKPYYVKENNNFDFSGLEEVFNIVFGIYFVNLPSFNLEENYIFFMFFRNKYDIMPL